MDKFEMKKTAIAASVLTIALTMIFVNHLLMDINQDPLTRSVAQAELSSTSSTRGLASVGQIVDHDCGLKCERALASQLASTSNREPASLGQRPDAFDRLAFEFLEGKYSLQLSQGRVVAAEFTDSLGEDRPKFVNDPQSFLLQYREALALDFARVEKSDDEQDQLLLINDLDQRQGVATFEYDEQGRLLAFRLKANE